MGDKHTPTLTASGDRIYGETPEDGIMVRVYGDPELAEKIACAVNRDHLFGELVKALKSMTAWIDEDYPKNSVAGQSINRALALLAKVKEGNGHG